MMLDTASDESNLSRHGKETIWLIISQINMLVCMVNDQLDF